MKRQLILSLVGCLFAQSGFAGGLAAPIVPTPVPPVPTAIPLDWYVGLQAGALSGDITVFDDDGSSEDLALAGPVAGVHAGVQRTFGSMTLGVELDYNTSSSDLEDGGTGVVVEMDALAHLKLRAGTEVGPVFVYGTGGLAYAAFTFDPDDSDAFEASDTAPFIGLGADVMVTESVSVGAEVLAHSFDDFGGEGFDMDFTTAMLRASYHF